LSYVLFFVYLLLCCFLLTRIKFVRQAAIETRIIVALFILKVGVGCLCGLLSMHDPSDSIKANILGWKEYQLLLQHPKEYLLDLFQSEYAKPYDGFFETHGSYWNDLSANMEIKLLSVFDLFSRGHYIVNVIFFNFITFFGITGLFRVFAQVYPGNKKLLIITWFLLPSLLCFSSMMHKEGLILAAIGILVFNVYYALNFSGFTWVRIFYISLSLLFIFVLRAYVLMALLPALIAWVFVHLKGYRPLPVFILIYSIGLILFFNLGRISARLDLPKIVTQRQADFGELPVAKTQIPMDTLYPSFKSFVCNAPHALGHSLKRPYFSDVRSSLLLLPFAVEITVYGLLLLIFIFLYKDIDSTPRQSDKTIILFGIFFSLSVFLLIGYIVPNIGSIVRYRAIYLPFILTPVLCGIRSGLIKKRVIR
jgi:hypothetical protein